MYSLVGQKLNNNVNLSFNTCFLDKYKFYLKGTVNRTQLSPEFKCLGLKTGKFNRRNFLEILENDR